MISEEEYKIMKEHVACPNDLVIMKDNEKQQNDIYSGNTEENFVDAKSITETENRNSVLDIKPIANAIYYLNPG